MSDTKAEREKEIPRQMVDIQESLAKLDTASCVLRDRLQPILKGDLMSPKEAKDEEESLVPMATELREIRRHIKDVLSTIRYLAEACEL